MGRVNGREKFRNAKGVCIAGVGIKGWKVGGGIGKRQRGVVRGWVG